MTSISRRELLESAVVSATTLALGTGASAATPAGKPAVEPPTALQTGDPADFPAFIDLSAALTGIKAALLRPGVDPTLFTVKLEYLKRASADPAFPALLKVYAANVDQGDPERKKAAAALLQNSDPKIRNLARSIVLAWYLGAWYSWPESGPAEAGPVKFTVVNADAYTQAWVWRIAEAHPMGYSNMRFGHWHVPPADALNVKHILLGGDPA
jgi:hypothetical protein